MCWKLKLTVRKFQRFLCSEAILGNSELASPKTCPTALFSKIFISRWDAYPEKNTQKSSCRFPNQKQIMSFLGGKQIITAGWSHPKNVPILTLLQLADVDLAPPELQALKRQKMRNSSANRARDGGLREMASVGEVGLIELVWQDKAISKSESIRSFWKSIPTIPKYLHSFPLSF